jgi:hypothetical protein
MGVVRLYAKVRVGRLFLIILCVFCGGWVAWNTAPWTPHFDDGGFSRLTLILSIEASIATSVLMAATEKQDELQRQQLIFLLHLMEAVHAQLTKTTGIDGSLRGPASPLEAPGGSAAPPPAEGP